MVHDTMHEMCMCIETYALREPLRDRDAPSNYRGTSLTPHP